MEAHRGQQACGALATPRVSSPVRSKGSFNQRSSQTLPESPTGSGDELQGPFETDCVVTNGKSVGSKEMCSKDVPDRAGFFLTGLPRAKAVRGLAPRNRFVGSERLSVRGVVRDGHTRQSKSSNATRHVGDVARSVRRISSHTHTRRASAISMLPSRRRLLQLSGSPVRPIRSSVGVYGSNETAQKVDDSDDDVVIPVPGRLVKRSPLVPPVSTHDGQVSATGDDVRTTSQSREVRIGADTVDHISRRKAGFCVRSSLHHPPPLPKGDIDYREDHHGNGSAGSSIPSGGVAIGLTHVRFSDDTAGTSTPALLADDSHPSDQAWSASAVLGEVSASRSGTPAVVAQEGFASTRHAVSTSPSTGDSVHGCVDGGLGHRFRGTDVAGQVATPRQPHQLARTSNSPARPATVTVPVEGKVGDDHDRQLDGGRVSEEGGRHPFPSVSPPLLPDSSTGIRLRRHASPNTSGGQAQCPSGSSLEDVSSGPLGVGHFATSVQLDSEQIAVGSASDRPIREQHEPPSSPVHVSLSRSRSRGNKRARGPVAKRRAVRLSSDLRRSTVVTASEAEDGRASPPSSPAQSARQVDALVAGTSASSDVEDPGIAEHVDAASLGVLPSSAGNDEPASVDHRSERLKNLGFSEAVIQRLEKARATSTSKQYKSKWDLFVGWATNSGRNPLSASLPLLAEFLVYLFRERRVSLQTIKNYRSAIAFYWRSTSGFEVPEKDRVLADLFRGFARESRVSGSIQRLRQRTTVGEEAHSGLGPVVGSQISQLWSLS